MITMIDEAPTYERRGRDVYCYWVRTDANGDTKVVAEYMIPEHVWRLIVARTNAVPDAPEGEVIPMPSRNG